MVCQSIAKLHGGHVFARQKVVYCRVKGRSAPLPWYEAHPDGCKGRPTSVILDVRQRDALHGSSNDMQHFDPRSALSIAAILAALHVCALSQEGNTKKLARPSEKNTDFAHEVLPLLKAHCIKCHTGDEPEGGFSMATREAILSA